MRETAIDILNGIKSGVDALQKENSELRECLKKAAGCIRDEFCTALDRNCLKCPEKCSVQRYYAALEGGNHAND